jgi:hypothetical protein
MQERDMRVPAGLYALEQSIANYLPHLRPAQQRGLALWVFGCVLAHSATQSAVSAALLEVGGYHALRQRLREWLYDGADRAAACAVELDVTACMAPLLRWVLAWWHGADLALAIDATAHGDKVVALVVSVLYRGCAIPVAWHILPANQPGGWMDPILALLERLAPAVPASLSVRVLADRGLWSPRLWGAIRQHGWHPLLRIQRHCTFRPAHGQPARADRWAQPGTAWIGTGWLGHNRSTRLAVTLLVVWNADQREPWVLVTDLPPTDVGACWYGLRTWIELGFRALKGVGWQWQRTRRTDPQRVARFWLVLAVASLYTLACGTRLEAADEAGVPPARLRRAPAPTLRTRARVVSVFRRGLLGLARRLQQGRLWRCWWLCPEPWPDPPPGLRVLVCLPAQPP